MTLQINLLVFDTDTADAPHDERPQQPRGCLWALVLFAVAITLAAGLAGWESGKVSVLLTVLVIGTIAILGAMRVMHHHH